MFLEVDAQALAGAADPVRAARVVRVLFTFAAVAGRRDVWEDALLRMASWPGSKAHLN